MATIKAFNDRLQAFDTEKVLMDVFMEANAIVIEKNLDQLQVGEDSKGNKLRNKKAKGGDGSYAWESYSEEKHAMNPLPGKGNPDLKYSGSFWQGFKVTKEGGTSYTIKSEDSKAGELVGMYGEDIYGLSDPKRGEFVSETYRPKLAAKVKELLQL
jgi:hypothetical protein